MTPLEHRKFELHTDTEGYRHRLADAKDWIHRVFDGFDNPCLNYSGGKDSLVLLNLLGESGYEPPVFHFDNGLLSVPGDTEFVRSTLKGYSGELFVRTSAAVNDERMVVEQGHGYNGFWGHYNDLAEREGWDCRLIGIRAAESNDRADRFDDTPINRHEQHTAAAPIHQLTTRDIWGYIVENDLDYHEIYDKQGELYGDMEARGNRLVTLYDSEFDSLGAREISQFVYPGETNAAKDAEHPPE